MGIISLRRQVSLGHCFIKRSSGIWAKQRPREGTLASVGRLDLVKQTQGGAVSCLARHTSSRGHPAPLPTWH